MSAPVRRFGWKRDRHDPRDYRFADVHRFEAAPLPRSCDLRPYFQPVYDQGDLGSCGPNAGAGLDEFLHRQADPRTEYTPSRLFLYYEARRREGTVAEDSGTELRDVMRVMNQTGCPHETLWPYDITKFTRKPPAAAYTDATKHLLGQYSRLDQAHDQLGLALVNRHPVLFGIMVYESMMTDAVAASGIVPMPKPAEKQAGGHAILMVGFNDITGRYIFRNSWGGGWGQRGYGELPYAYVHSPDLAGDLWTAIRAA
jgi:C1A family cysteine protease